MPTEILTVSPESSSNVVRQMRRPHVLVGERKGMSKQQRVIYIYDGDCPFDLSMPVGTGRFADVMGVFVES